MHSEGKRQAKVKNDHLRTLWSAEALRLCAGGPDEAKGPEQSAVGRPRGNGCGGAREEEEGSEKAAMEEADVPNQEAKEEQESIGDLIADTEAASRRLFSQARIK
jgi:hypothetical protein